VLINWLLFPLLLVVACAGHGLLIRRITGGPSWVLLLPTGFASLLTLCLMAMAFRPLHSVAWLALVLPALAGWALGWAETRTWRASWTWDSGWAAAAGLGAFAVFAAPVVLSGELTFTGFSVITDIANHFDLTARLVEVGRVKPQVIDSSYAESVQKLLGSHYPVGMHSVLGASSELLGREPAFLYQPLVAFAGPMGALAGFGLLRRLRLPLALAALGGFVMIQPNLLYQYSLAAGFKELIGVAMILTMTALLVEALELGGRRILAVAVPIAGGIAVFSATIGPWIAAIVAVFLVVSLVGAAATDRVRLAATWVGTGVLACVLGWPTLVTLRGDASTASNIVGVQSDKGNLATPLEPLSSVGTWITGDFRYALVDHRGATHFFIVVTLLLVAVAIVGSLRRWSTAPLALALSAGVTMLVLPPRVSPWIDAKVFTVNGAIILAVAFCGVGVLAAHRRSAPVAWALAAVVAAGVVWGNALSYHNTTLASPARLHALERIDSRYAGQGPTLAPSFDEYAEYFLRDMTATGRVNPPDGFPGASVFGADIDQVQFDFVEKYRTIVIRRHPARSRPPGNYELVERGRIYDVWKRITDGREIARHFPLEPGRRTAKRCAEIAQGAAEAGPGWELRWAVPNAPNAWIPTSGTWSPAFAPNGTALFTFGPGHADGGVDLHLTSRYELWLEGSFGRAVSVFVDGRRVGSVENDPDYPGEVRLLTTMDLSRGVHKVRVTRGGGSLEPGNGDEARSRYIGPLYFLRTDDPGGELHTAPVSALKSLCASDRSMDWIELVRPGAPAGAAHVASPTASR